jgi:aspartokinase
MGVFHEKNIRHIEEKLAEINIKLANEATETPGIIATLSTELMINNINIYELMSCVPEMLLFVKQKDVVKTYEILFDMCRL